VLWQLDLFVRGEHSVRTLRHVDPALTLPPVTGKEPFQLVPSEAEKAPDPDMLNPQTHTVLSEPAAGMSQILSGPR